MKYFRFSSKKELYETVKSLSTYTYIYIYIHYVNCVMLALVAERGFSDDDLSFYVFVDVPHTLPPVPSYDDPSAIDDGHQLQEDFDFLECLVVGMQLKNELRKPYVHSPKDWLLIFSVF